MHRKTLVALALLITSWAPGSLPGQTVAPEPGRSHATRDELQALLTRHELSAKSGAYSEQLRERARYEASLIKQRLEQGDFQVGDRIAITVDNEPTLSDTLVVSPDLTVALASGEALSLKRVLRSEVQPLIHAAIAKVVKNPNVRTESFLRIGIMGAVGSQGFFVVKADALLSDVLMSSGGIAQTADLKNIRVERDSKTIWDGEALQQALTEGRTVDQLSLRAGDMLIVGQQAGKKSVGGFLQSARALVFVIPGLIALGRLLGL
jgi:protein involved in polysaccharide export with SLBB domain